MPNLIEARHLTKIHNRRKPDEITALHDASFSVEAGACAVFRGPSGSGKTTLLSLVGCMARPTSGEILVEGRDVGRLPERFLTDIRRRTFGFVFQQYHLFPDLCAEDNVLLPLVPLPLPVERMRRRAAEVLEKLDLSPKRRVKVSRLSGGEQQRVALARALIGEPRILIADEPTAHLDRALAGQLMGIFRTLREDGVTLLIATHDPFVFGQPFVTRLFDLKDGHLAAEASA
jgi:putative ABC transport system ATP-binding protein